MIKQDSEVKEKCNRLTIGLENFNKKLKENNEEIRLVNTEIREIKTQLENLSNIFPMNKVNEQCEKIKSLEHNLMGVEKKNLFLESKQYMIQERFNDIKNKIYEQKQENTDESLPKTIHEIKKYFHKTKIDLEITIQRLKRENELILNEHKRIYENDRNREFNSMKNNMNEFTKEKKSSYYKLVDLFQTSHKKLNKTVSDIRGKMSAKSPLDYDSNRSVNEYNSRNINDKKCFCNGKTISEIVKMNTKSIRNPKLLKKTTPILKCNKFKLFIK